MSICRWWLRIRRPVRKKRLQCIKLMFGVAPSLIFLGMFIQAGYLAIVQPTPLRLFYRRILRLVRIIKIRILRWFSLGAWLWKLDDAAERYVKTRMLQEAKR